jgi:hypothetical protein
MPSRASRIAAALGRPLDDDDDDDDDDAAVEPCDTKEGGR